MNSSIFPLLELTVKGTAVLLAAYGGIACLTRASAAQRSLCWLGIFVTMLLLPLALVTPPVWTVPVRAAAQSPAVNTPEPASGDKASGPASRPSPTQISFQAWLGIIYGCGFVGVLGFRLLGTAQLWKLRRASTPDAKGQAVVDGWRAEIGMRRPVQVCSSPEVTVPMTYGAWFPVILLPGVNLWRTPNEWHAALRHEFAHVRHGDAARRWLGAIVVALWWPHPLVWAASRAWNLEQERSCDDAVLNGGADAADYAQQLLHAACHGRLSRSQSAAALIMAMPGGLETRLRSITSPQMDRSPARRAALLPIAALAIAITLSDIAFQTPSAAAAPQGEAQDSEAIALRNKANAAVIPILSVREATVEEVIAQITKASGVKIFYTPKKENQARVTIELTRVPASEAIHYVAGLTNLAITYKKDGVYLTDLPPDHSPTPPRSAPEPTAQAQDAETTALRNKANAAVIPILNVREATVEEVIAQITKASGVKIFYTPKKENQARVTMELTRVPASEAITYAAGLSNLTITYKEDGVYLTDLPPDHSPTPPKSAPEPRQPLGAAVSLITKEWKIPTNFPATLPKSAKPGSAQEDLTAAGIVFPAGSSAEYSRDHSRLIVRNTQKNLDLVDALLEASLRK